MYWRVGNGSMFGTTVAIVVVIMNSNILEGLVWTTWVRLTRRSSKGLLLLHVLRV